MGTRLYMDFASDADLVAAASELSGILVTVEDLEGLRVHESQRPAFNDQGAGYEHYKVTQANPAWAWLSSFLIFGLGRLSNTAAEYIREWGYADYSGAISSNRPDRIYAMLTAMGVEVSHAVRTSLVGIHWS